ncbi:Eukaryotic translation initiation factor 4G [Quillaja saponaria]|uniref:Eukaryotic translation initiation factor 4G n=1 Tax=Quillaja saponaria TaxID=32244 RepID=A0AAD7PN26_QUISA|nr:Eukaryotic translation initiation factor 4G [Quillaja saponaria]
MLMSMDPLQLMHKAEKKYEVGKVIDEEQAKQRQPPRKGIGVVDQSNTLESHSVTKAKKDGHVSTSPSLSQMSKPSALRLTGISMSVPYHQSQTSVQFGGPNQQIQSQGMSTASLHMPIPMPLPMGNPPQVQHQVFVPGLQPHPIHPQGIMSGQNMSYTAQMGPQMLPQLGYLGNIGIGISPQYAQHQGGNFGGPRNTIVKITHPDTHEVVILDKVWPPPPPLLLRKNKKNKKKCHPSNSYDPNSVFFPSSSRPLTSSQIAQLQHQKKLGKKSQLQHQKKPGKKSQLQHQVGGQSVTVSSLPSRAIDSSFSAAMGSSETVETSNEAVSASYGTSEQQFASVSNNDLPEATTKHDIDGVGNTGGGLISIPVLGSKDRPILKKNKAKAASKGKKKRKEILQKADAAGTTSDLYNAYRGPEDRKKTVVSSESKENASVTGSMKQVPTDYAQTDSVAREKGRQTKVEPDDWEDDADMSTPKLEVADRKQQVGDGAGNLAKKYSRDFLLKFKKQCVDLPVGFEITADTAEALMNANVNGSHLVERDSYPCPGRIIDRPSGTPLLDCRGSGVVEEERRNKFPGSFGSGRDICLDTTFGGNQGCRPGHGGNLGVLRNPHAQARPQHRILSGPLQSMGHQGGMQRSSPDAERWQRATHFLQRGLIPTPHTPLQMMHKAEKKYEVGEVTDEEQAKQRQLKAILNKLTPQNFEKLFEQVKAVNIDNAVTLTGVISQIFDKALMEPTFCEMYANFCFHLASELPDFSEDNEKITFKRLLLNKCQEEFERGEREQEEANKVDEEGEVKQSEEEREQKRIKARRRMLGNIRLIGELYKKRMLTERIMHECLKKLLGQYQDPDEEDIESLCKLMSTIREMIDHPQAKEHMDAYFERMKMLSNNMNLSSRVRFMLKDVIDLRKNKWQQRRKVEGPKKIEEVHRDAAQEVNRLGHGPGSSPSTRWMPMDFGPRGSTMLSYPNDQDVRMDDTQSFDARTSSVPFTQRPAGDDSITLGPQGGLAKGKPIIVPPAIKEFHRLMRRLDAQAREM